MRREDAPGAEVAQADKEVAKLYRYGASIPASILRGVHPFFARRATKGLYAPGI